MTPARPFALVLPLLAAALTPPPGLAQSGPEPAVETAPEETAAEGEPGKGSALVLFPAGRLYGPYAADPRDPTFGLVGVSVSDVGVADSGDTRFVLRLGGSFGVLRRHPEGRPDRGWQLGIDAGFYGQFDVDNDYDNIGWDGIYGLSLTRAGERLGWKLAIKHTSSHVGDELEERTGRRRIGYTREEAVVGVDRRFGRHFRAYAEAGWGYDLRNEDLQEPGRAQVGVELGRARSLWRGRAGWYAAIDLAAWEERDWEVETSAQLGLTFPSAERRWRLGVAYRDGAVPIGEFFQDEERYLALGIWLDL